MRRRNDSARHEGRVFRSLTVPNYRRYFWGSFVSNIGVWMQRTAQVWVVMQLSGGNGVALRAEDIDTDARHITRSRRAVA